MSLERWVQVRPKTGIPGGEHSMSQGQEAGEEPADGGPSRASITF